MRLARAKRVFYTTKWPESNQWTNCIDCIFIALLSIYSRSERMLSINLVAFGWKIRQIPSKGIEGESEMIARANIMHMGNERTIPTNLSLRSYKPKKRRV